MTGLDGIASAAVGRPRLHVSRGPDIRSGAVSVSDASSGGPTTAFLFASLPGLEGTCRRVSPSPSRFCCGRGGIRAGYLWLTTSAAVLRIRRRPSF